MAYKIQYSPEAANRYPQIKKRSKSKFVRLAGIVLIFAAVLWLRINGIPDFMIPGDPEITKTAAVRIVNDLQGGTAVNEAVTTFCKTIIHGAGI